MSSMTTLGVDLELERPGHGAAPELLLWVERAHRSGRPLQHLHDVLDHLCTLFRPDGQQWLAEVSAKLTLLVGVLAPVRELNQHSLDLLGGSQRVDASSGYLFLLLEYPVDSEGDIGETARREPSPRLSASVRRAGRRAARR
jgi:hypothetical protein